MPIRCWTGLLYTMLSLGLFGCNGSIIGLWSAYSYNKSELPISICERDLCDGVQDFTLMVDDNLEGDFRLEVMVDSEYYIYTFPLTAQLTKPSEQDDLWTLRVDNSENQTYPQEWTCWVRGKIADCTVDMEGDMVVDTYQIKR